MSDCRWKTLPLPGTPSDIQELAVGGFGTVPGARRKPVIGFVGLEKMKHGGDLERGQHGPPSHKETPL